MGKKSSAHLSVHHRAQSDSHFHAQMLDAQHVRVKYHHGNETAQNDAACINIGIFQARLAIDGKIVYDASEQQGLQDSERLWKFKLAGMRGNAAK